MRPNHEVAVLRHVLLPFVAFASPRTDGRLTMAFVDRPDLAAAISEFAKVKVLTSGQLAVPLARTDVTDLTSTEHDQINYWRPDTIGELLFNCWD